jgi:curved DNA-binding protein
LAGQGAPGSDGKRGDLYLEIRFKPHPWYRVVDKDLYLTLPVAPWEAALGAEVTAPTPGGKVEVSIPMGSQTGRKLRLKGRGLPASEPGDLYIELKVVLPAADNPKAAEAYKRMASELRFNPRLHFGV